MKKLMTATDRIELGFFKGVLEAEGIACMIKNELLGGALGELPVNETWPEVWVADQDLERAQQHLKAMQPSKEAKPWCCHRCNELIDAEFALCWRCAGSPESA